ncbi:MAG TPA: aconitate hydratase AcnA [Thermodesulfobacteriota bacterium]
MATATGTNSFGSRATLAVGADKYEIYRLDALGKAKVGHVDRLPFSLKVLLENLLRHEDGRTVRREDIEALAAWDPKRASDREIAFRPARILLQDFTGVPAVVDLTAMRQAIQAMGGDPKKINPLQRTDLVIDHSVQVDTFGASFAFARNVEIEMERNRERYQFLRWGGEAFQNFTVVPPGTGICHQVNLEYLASTVFQSAGPGGARQAYPDTVIGADSHTTMINGIGVLGWGAGGIECEAAMLGQPISMLIPAVVGFKLHGRLREGVTATDLVLTVTQMLRQKGVVGKFVEFYGPGLTNLSAADRATIGNMAPEYGATVGFFPVDAVTLDYLRFTGRPEAVVALVERYCKEQGLFRTDATPDPIFSDTLELDLATVEASLAGPRRPQDRVSLQNVKANFSENLPGLRAVKKGADPAAQPKTPQKVAIDDGRTRYDLADGSVVIAAITSCTNTSNPSVLLGAGLLAKKAVQRGLRTMPWVKTSLAPGSKVVTDYLAKAGLMPYLQALGFHLVGYGCTTCIGNSGPLPEKIAAAQKEANLVVAAVLSGNRNFEGRIHAQVRANYLASPPLVVAFALAGTVDIDLTREPIGTDPNGQPVYLKDIWPTSAEVAEAIRTAVTPEMFRTQYGAVLEGDPTWREMRVPTGDLFAWDPNSTYVKHPPYFEGMGREPKAPSDIRDARVLVSVGDSVTTDHISPAGAIQPDSPAGRYLIEHGVKPADFNSYGARRGNHEVMARGTFASIRVKNLVAPGTEGGVTRHFPDGTLMSIYDAAMKYQAEGVPLLILAGKEYGTGSSRDWAAKGPMLLGVKAVIAESFERIHRSNLVGMGILPLQYLPGENRTTLGLTGEEVYTIEGIADDLRTGKRMTVTARAADGKTTRFETICRIDTPQEIDYYRHGGILQYVLRSLAANGQR